MVQKQQIQPTNNINSPSKLERFNLGFEFDKTIQQVKQDMRSRTLDKIK